MKASVTSHPPLKRGDAVALVATSSHLVSGTEPRIAAAVALLESWGLRVVLAENLQARHLYLAGQDVIRAQEFQRLYLDPEIRAVFTLRGGYGAARMLPYLDPDRLRKQQKPVIGFSDVTSLLVALQQWCQMEVLYGPCLATEQFLEAPEAPVLQQALRNWLFQEERPVAYPVEAFREGQATGRLVGGCLSLLVTTLGTPLEVNTEGALLFLEEVGEAPYCIDRMLTHLKTAGKLQSIRGLVFGRFQDCGTPEALQSMLEDVLAEVPGPIGWNLPCGHGPLNLPLPLGAMAELDTVRQELRFRPEAPSA